MGISDLICLVAGMWVCEKMEGEVSSVFVFPMSSDGVLNGREVF